MSGDGVNEDLMQLFFDKRYYSMFSTLINAIQTSNYNGSKDIMTSPLVADKILSESERCEVSTVVWTIIICMFRNFVQNNLYDVRYGGTGSRRRPCNGTLKNITRMVSSLLVSKIVYSLPFFFNGSDAEGGCEDDHEVNDTTKMFANYFVTGFSSIVFEIVIRRIQISSIVSTILLLTAIFVGIMVLNIDNTASLLIDTGYKNDEDNISIFVVCGFCILLTRIFGCKKILCFLLVIAILALPSLRNLIFEILGSIWRFFVVILTLLTL
jgi:hypothetical protein